jgi:hypothetical protein
MSSSSSRQNFQFPLDFLHILSQISVCTDGLFLLFLKFLSLEVKKFYARFLSAQTGFFYCF